MVRLCLFVEHRAVPLMTQKSKSDVFLRYNSNDCLQQLHIFIAIHYYFIGLRSFL